MVWANVLFLPTLFSTGIFPPNACLSCRRAVKSFPPRTPWKRFKSLWHWPFTTGLWKFSIVSLEHRNTDHYPFQRLGEINYPPLLQMSLKLKCFPKLSSVIRHPQNIPLKYSTPQALIIKYMTLKDLQTRWHPLQSLGHSCLQDTIFSVWVWPERTGGKSHLKNLLKLSQHCSHSAESSVLIYVWYKMENYTVIWSSRS